MIYPWIFVSFFLLSPTLLFSAEVNYPTQKDVTDALHSIGTFLKDDGGPEWLAGLVTKQSAPLTTDDLMNEILNSSKADENIKKAANIIKLALDEQRQRGPNKTLVLEFDGWKDMIDSIEQENDIICLYRRSYNASSERSDDWQKFLKNISPDYTIYLALDMGQKYVICLKKINVPDREIAARDLDKANDTIAPLMDTSVRNSSNITENERPSGSRSMNHVDKPGNTEKCDTSDAQTENDESFVVPPTIPNHARRQLPLVHPDSPCSRPIFLMMPPNYMPPVNNYAPIWPRTGYQAPPGPAKPPAIPFYQTPFIPSSLTPQFPPYHYPIPKYRNDVDHRKHFTIPPKFTHSPEPQDEKLPASPSHYSRSSAPITPDHGPTRPVNPVRYQPSFRPIVPYSGHGMPPLARTSFGLPWPSSGIQPDHGLKPASLMYPLLVPGHVPPVRPSLPYRSPPTLPLHYSPPLPQPNCMSCVSPCDRPILLKVMVENPVNQPVKIGLVSSKETPPGRRQMSEGVVESEMENVNEKTGEVGEESGDKEIG